MMMDDEESALFVYQSLERTKTVTSEIRQFVRDNPKSLQTEMSGYGRRCCVFHNCCQFDFPLPIFEFLLEEDPEAYNKVDEYGWHPLHYSGQKDDLVNKLLDHNPANLWIRTQKPEGTLPIHYRIHNSHHSRVKSHLPMIQKYVRLAPGSLMARTAQGKVPLHYITKDRQIEILHWLMEECPASVNVLEKTKGWSPFHSTVQAMAFSAARLILSASPLAVLIKVELPLESLCAESHRKFWEREKEAGTTFMREESTKAQCLLDAMREGIHNVEQTANFPSHISRYIWSFLVPEWFNIPHEK